MKRLLIILMTCALVTSVTAQRLPSKHPKQFKRLARHMPAEWYSSQEALSVADSVMKYQFPSGGWAKNQDWHLPVSGKKLAERQEIINAIHSKEGVGSTIDNDATTTEMMLLAKVYAATGRKDCRKAFIRGLEYLVAAQYDNGGWPQYYPYKPLNNEGEPFYSDHITFNDNAMVNVMLVLRDIRDNRKPYTGLKLSDKQRNMAGQAFDKGVQCIISTQIRKNGKLTVWCQQHNEKTLEPAAARAYELPSFTGSGETPRILQLLMDLPEPSAEVVSAVTAAVEWLKAHAIRDMAIEYFTNRDGQPDRRLVHRFGAPLIWARYYDLDTEEPYICDRDGVKQPALEYIGYERRNGYGWYGDGPQAVIDAYPAWIKAHENK